MIIKTEYGSINSDSIEGNSEGAEFLKGHADAAEIFFAEEIDVEIDNDDIRDSIIEVIIDNKFDYPERALALADEMGKTFDMIEESDWGNNKIFIVDDDGEEEWMVMTDDEADIATKERIENSLDDIGMFELFNENLQMTILENNDLVDNAWFDEYMEEDTRSYIDEIANESTEDEPEEGDYLNRLHEELCNLSILSEPDYPELPDEDDDDYDKMKEEYDEYLDELKDIIESNKEVYVEQRLGEYDSGVEWYRDNFGDESLKEIVQNHDLADNEKIAEWVFDNEYTTRGNEISSYDGAEFEANIDYKGENYWFYLYRIN